MKRRVFAMGRRALASSRYVKLLVVVAFDIFAALLTVWMAFSFTRQLLHQPEGLEWLLYLLAPALMLPIFALSGIYGTIQRYNSFEGFITVFKSVFFYGAAFVCLLLLLPLPKISIVVGILQPLLLLLMTGGSRAMVRYLSTTVTTTPEKRCEAPNKLLIYGAGSAGVEIVNSINRSNKFTLAGFIDDNPDLQGRTINRMKVFSPAEAEELIQSEGINNILLAMPSATRTRRNEIVEQYRKYPVRIQMLPGVEELAEGKVTISDIKTVDIEDLLGRDPAPLDHALVKQVITGRVVMVTGAGGSIGSELCRQLLQAQPSTLLLLDNAEHNLYTIHSDLTQRHARLSSATRIVPLLCDVTNAIRITEIFRVFQPEVIYHAAAYKHVPMVEHNPAEGIRNNVFGTHTVAEAALQQGVTSVVLVSTDKAVRPTNVMGASKRLCEMILQALAEEPGHTTCFSMVRFGNVLGSSGSVVPLFRSQINSGGPFTITHKEITRYFMTIPEAAQLVIQAGAMASPGDLHLLEMGDPVKIIDLARKMVELSGLTIRDHENPEGDIEIRVTGLRPGEKLYEELLIGNHSSPSANPRIFKAKEHFIPWSELQEELEQLTTAIHSNDIKSIKKILKKIVPEYSPGITTSDLLSMEKQSKNGKNHHIPAQ
ncbi:polysaccharide biosynthesis protein [Pelodictyon phaeoclathratiforme]|nr:nucleoside-diphosphate sugar epimerase/dehydratase [Pelodictyon phaeoclathratiforme]